MKLSHLLRPYLVLLFLVLLVAISGKSIKAQSSGFLVINNSNSDVYFAYGKFLPGSSRSGDLMVFTPDRWLAKGWYKIAANRQRTVYNSSDGDEKIYLLMRSNGRDIVPSQYDHAAFFCVYQNHAFTSIEIDNESRFELRHTVDSQGNYQYYANERSCEAVGGVMWQFYRFSAMTTFTIHGPSETVRSIDSANGATFAFGGPFGDWQTTEACPYGQAAYGIALKVEGSQGSGDDTALNGIALSCGNPTPGENTTITSGVQIWGAWSNWANCSSGFIRGVRLRIEPPQHSGDDTGAVDAEFMCLNGEILRVGPHFGWGYWSDWQFAPPNHVICRIQTKIEAQQGKGDDTALNDAIFTYCRYN